MSDHILAEEAFPENTRHLGRSCDYVLFLIQASLTDVCSSRVEKTWLLAMVRGEAFTCGEASRETPHLNSYQTSLVESLHK
jgi:hypothetical protein